MSCLGKTKEFPWIAICGRQPIEITFMLLKYYHVYSSNNPTFTYLKTVIFL